jgi:hypothetical protein
MEHNIKNGMVLQLATDWAFQGSKLVGDEIFRIRPDRPWDPPNFLNKEYRVNPCNKATKAWR